MTACQARTAGKSPTSWLCPPAPRRFVRLPDPILDRIQRRMHAKASTGYFSLSFRSGPSRPRHIQAGPGTWRDSQCSRTDLTCAAKRAPAHASVAGSRGGPPGAVSAPASPRAHPGPPDRPNCTTRHSVAGRHRCGARHRCHTAGAPLSHCANKRARPSGQPTLPRELHVPPPVASAGPREVSAAQFAHLHAYELLQ